MHKNEVLLFKQADSDYRKPSRISFHMAVADPAAKNIQPPPPARQSIETRLMCWFLDEDVDTVPKDFMVADGKMDDFKDPKDFRKFFN